MKFIKYNETKIEMHFNDKNINAMNNFLKNETIYLGFLYEYQ